MLCGEEDEGVELGGFSPPSSPEQSLTPPRPASPGYASEGAISGSSPENPLHLYQQYSSACRRTGFMPPAHENPPTLTSSDQQAVQNMSQYFEFQRQWPSYHQYYHQNQQFFKQY